MKKYIILIFSIALTINSVDAQIIDTARLRLDFKPQILNFQKINQKAIIDDTVTTKVKFDYYITPQREDITFAPATITAEKMPADVIKRLYRDFLKVGFGYPLTPLAELSIHNPDNRKYSYGLNFHHFSSWSPQIGKNMKKYAYAPTSDTKTLLFFNRFFKNQTFYSSVAYNHELAKLYGFNRNNLTTQQAEYYNSPTYSDTLDNSFHHLKAELGLRSNYILEDKKLKQDARINYDFLYTHAKDMENHIGFNAFFAYDARFIKISGSQNYRLDLDVDYYNNRWADTLLGMKRIDNSAKIELKPTVQFTIKEYHLLFGLGIPIVNNYGDTKVPVYPIGEIQLGIVPGILTIYAGVDGGVQYNSLKDLLYENPYLKPHLDTLKFTKSRISINGGIKGNLVKKLNYHISARYSYEKDMHFFLLDTASLLKNQFDVLYADGNKLNVCFNLNWEVIDHLYLNMDANYWGYYFLQGVDFAWYKPTWQLAFSGKYTLKSKYIIGLNFDLEFDRWALMQAAVPGTYEAKKMGPVLDFGVGFEYIITPQFSAFANINNLAYQTYSKYYDFKSFGINILAGITYSFGDESLKVKKTQK
jgi:hypothetical protein